MRSARLGIVCVLALGLAACGGGSTPKPLSRDNYIRKADSLCALASAQIEFLPETPALDAGRQPIQNRAAMDLTRAVLTQIEALGAPTADKAYLAAAYAQVRAVLDYADATGLLPTDDQMAEPHQQLAAYGMNDCATKLGAFHSYENP